MSITGELVARVAALERKLAALEAKERPLVLRGWRDDFFGDSLHGQYFTAVSEGTSSVALLAGHGGWVRLRAGPANGRWARIWLGDAADGYPTLDADLGYVVAVRMAINRTTNIQAAIEIGNATGIRYIAFGIRTDVIANNWIIRTTDGVTTNVDTGVAADTDPHWHVANVYPITGGRQIDYFLDGALIGSKTTNMPTELLTPNMVCVNRNVAANCDMDIDVYDVIPRNL